MIVIKKAERNTQTKCYVCGNKMVKGEVLIWGLENSDKQFKGLSWCSSWHGNIQKMRIHAHCVLDITNNIQIVKGEKKSGAVKMWTVKKERCGICSQSISKGGVMIRLWNMGVFSEKYHPDCIKKLIMKDAVILELHKARVIKQLLTSDNAQINDHLRKAVMEE